MGKHFYYLSEVAALLGWSEQWTGTQLRRGTIPAERIGERGHWRVRRVALREFAQQEGISLDWEMLEKVQDARAKARVARQAGTPPPPRPAREFA